MKWHKDDREPSPVAGQPNKVNCPYCRGTYTKASYPQHVRKIHNCYKHKPRKATTRRSREPKNYIDAVLESRRPKAPQAQIHFCPGCGLNLKALIAALQLASMEEL